MLCSCQQTHECPSPMLAGLGLAGGHIKGHLMIVHADNGRYGTVTLWGQCLSAHQVHHEAAPLQGSLDNVSCPAELQG